MPESKDEAFRMTYMGLVLLVLDMYIKFLPLPGIFLQRRSVYVFSLSSLNKTALTEPLTLLGKDKVYLLPLG